MDTNQCKAQGGEWKDNKCIIPESPTKLRKFPKNKKRKVIFGSVSAVALLSILFLNFVPIGGAPIVESIQKQYFPMMESNFILKGGILNPVPSTGMDWEVDGINWLIDNVYGVAIFDAPLIFNQNDLNELAAMMGRMNSEILDEDQGQYFSGVLFSDDLITRIKANNFGLTDLMYIKNELMESADIYCSAITQYLEDNPNGEDDVDMIKELCDSKPADIFKFNLGRYTLSLNDFDYYEYQWNSTCTQEVAICSLTNRTRVFVGTVRTSDINMIVTQKGGDIFVGLNQKGINEVNAIETRYEFAQYAYQLEHKDALTSLNQDQAGYAVISNNQDVVDAGEGLIKETSRIDDLWYGLKEGKLLTSPAFYINFVLITIIIACGVGAIL